MVEETKIFCSSNIEKPWKKRNYKEVVRFYEIYEKYLPAEHKARLEFARQPLKK
jgi:hypothetical protein